MKIKIYLKMSLKVILSTSVLLISGCSFINPTLQPATKAYVDQQTTRSFGHLDAKITDLKKLEKQLDSLVTKTERNNLFIEQLKMENITLSSEFSNQLLTKDHEIQKLNLQISSMDKLIGNYDGILDSLMNLSSKQSSFYETLYSIDSSDTSLTSADLQKKQMAFVEQTLNNLQNNYSSLAKTTKNLYEDLSIVESSIMDIIQFSFDKAAKQINEKNVLLTQKYNEMNELLDSLNMQLAQLETRELTNQNEILSITANIDSLNTNFMNIQNTQNKMMDIQLNLQNNYQELKFLLSVKKTETDTMKVKNESETNE